MIRKRSTNIVQPVLNKPKIGGSVDEWGLILNENIDKTIQFNSQLIADSENQNQELARLEREKVSKTDVPEIIEPVVQEFLETTIKPEIDDYIDTVSKPAITQHVESKKLEINQYVNETSKPALDAYEKEKEGELNSYTQTKKGELDTHTIQKQEQLDAYEKTKETELDEYTSSKQTQLDEYITSKKGELDTHTQEKKTELDSYTTTKSEELDNHTNTKKSELDSYEKVKEGELDTYNATKKSELDEYTLTKKTELNEHTNTKKEEITAHTDEEIKRINVETIIGDKLDKGGYEGTAQDLKNLIDSKPNTEVVAGQGLKSSQVENQVTVSIESADEGIIVNEDNIQLNVVNDLLTGGVKRPLSAEQGKILKQLIDTIGQGGTQRLLRRARAIGDFDYIGTLTKGGNSIAVGSTLFKPTLYLDGTRIDKNSYSVELETGLITLSQIYSPNYDVVWVVEDNYPYHIKFSYPTLNLLQNDNTIKKLIEIGDVIEILGESEADDGDHRLVKCGESQGLNGVDIGNGRWLNEIPNTRGSKKANASDLDKKQNKTDNSLQTDSKEIIGAINESLWRTLPKQIQNGIDILIFAIQNNQGHYINDNDGYTYTNKPTNDKKFNLAIIKNTGYASVIFKPFNKNTYYINTMVDGAPVWSGWSEVLTSDNRLFLGNSGISKVIYIQDAGQKTAGKGYVDKTTGQLYLCKTTNSDVTVTDKFVLATNIENSKKLEDLNKNEYTLVFNGTFFNLYENHSGYLVSIFQNQLLNPAGKLEQVLKSPLSLASNLSMRVAIDSTHIENGGCGMSDLSLVVSQYLIAIINQGENSTKRYTVGGVYYIPKAPKLYRP